MFQENRLKRRIARGERVYGAWLSLASPAVAELMAAVGFDFLIVDQEHGAGSLQDAAHMLRASAAVGCPAIVRVPWNDQVYLKRILDLGAQSLMIPMVETAEEAAAAVAACRYPPRGRRGYAAPAMRCSGYGTAEGYVARAHEELFLIVQIESAAAAERAEAIAAVDGVDMVLIGVNDLAGSIGRLEQLDHPEVDALVRRAEAGIRAAGKPLGTVPSARRDTGGLFRDGYSLVAGAGDSVLLREAAGTHLAAIRAVMETGR
ncbi:HpcH/HpaI aldolase family protein [Benzoatithermus flavus]|uniref:Aldolase/citrate lyase family protein n=1 Tax=Benzoatithermus flavus TaxID=3108223 RepID=A0ABU8XZJ2_9PROT